MPAPAPAPRSSRGPLLAGLGALVALAVVATAVTLVVVGRDDDRADTEAGGGRIPLARSGEVAAAGVDLLGEPTGQWDFDPDEVVPGGAMGSVREHGDGLPPIEALAFGDVVVVTVGAAYEEGVTPSGELVGLDATSGDVVWRLPSSDYPSCTPVRGDTILMCTGMEARDKAAPDPEPTSVVLVDPVAGEVLAESEETLLRPAAVPGSEELLVVEYGGDRTGSMALSSLDPDDLSTRWTTDLDTSAADTELYFSADDRGGADQLVVAAGGLRWSVDRADGTVGETVTDPSFAVEDGYRVQLDYEADTTRVTDLSGFTVLEAPGQAWWGEDGETIRDGRLGAGSALYDLTTGATVWDSDVVAGSFSSTRAGGRVVMGPTVTDGDAQPFDAATGEPYFSGDNVFSGAYGSWFGPDAVADVDVDGLLQMRELDGGQVRWSRDVLDLVDPALQQAVAVTAAGPALVAAGNAGVRGWVGFPADAGSGDAVATAGEAQDGSGTAYVTDCGTEPELTPVEAVAEDGGVKVTYAVVATCPDGQWLAHTDTYVDLVVDGAPYLSGDFDFSVDPRWVPAEGTELDLVYPPGSAFATPEEVNDAIEDDGGSGEVVQVDCDRADASVAGAVPADPSDAAPGTDPIASAGPAADDADAGESALETLRRMAAEDAPYLDAEAAGSWLPQLSSKDDGLVADGITWDYEEILAEHLRLRLRYPDVRLVYSTDWDSYQLDDFWVTVVASETSPTPEPALAFCVDESFDREHCYAKQLVREGSWEDRTRMLPEG